MAKFLVKYPAAMKTLEKDREELLVFTTFPQRALGINKNDESDLIGFCGTEATTPTQKNCGSRKRTISMLFNCYSLLRKARTGLIMI
ncbi:MAG: hypothetical protein ACTS73_07280 [Arsenophonus sp. NEOnobi-MAG3]